MTGASESVLEDVKEVIEYARSHNLFNAPASEGSRTVFNEEKAKERFAGGSNYSGVAANFFSMELLKWGVKGQVVAKASARQFGKNISWTHWRCPSQLPNSLLRFIAFPPP